MPADAQLPSTPPVPRSAWSRLAAFTAAAALLQLDGTLITVALPSVAHGLHIGTSSTSVLLSVYFATYAAAADPGRRARRPVRGSAGGARRPSPVRRRSGRGRARGQLRRAVGGARGARRRGRARQPGRARRRRLGLPAGATRPRARHLGRQRRHVEPPRPAARRRLDRGAWMARRLVGARAADDRRRAGDCPADARDRPRRQARPPGAQPDCAGGHVGRGAHVRGHDRRLLHRRAVPPAGGGVLGAGSLRRPGARGAAGRRRRAHGREARRSPRGAAARAARVRRSRPWVSRSSGSRA